MVKQPWWLSMLLNDKELTILSEEEIWEANGRDQLEVLRQYDTIAAIYDLVVLTCGYCEDTCTYMAPDDNSLKREQVGFIPD